MKSWYDRKGAVIFMIFLFFPIGLYALWKNKDFKPITKKIITAICVLVTLIIFVPESMPDTSLAVPYTIVNRSDFSFAGRDRYSIAITAPEATNAQQFAQTAIQAAINIQKETGFDVVSVDLEPSIDAQGSGLQYAIVRYAPDGLGLDGQSDWKWTVEAAEKRIDPVEVLMSVLWWKNRGKFQVDSMTDEPALKKFIAGKIGVSADAVSLPYVVRKPYNL